MTTASPAIHRIAMLLSSAGLFAAGVAVGAFAPRADMPRVLAATAVADDSFAACTAAIDDGIEGLFLLDFETGDLTGGVLNRTTSKFSTGYRCNVLKDLGFKAGKAKGPKFLLTTGLADFAGNAGTAMARSVLYVTDASTGVTVAYAIPWNAQQANAAAPTSAQLVPLDQARPRGGKAP
ncbi:MAG: hypothetical protein ACKOSQ_00795 [Planctomycetaceae bacterium]